jgi:hypothetical protein
MMIEMISTYCVLMYLFGVFVLYAEYTEGGVITIVDVVMYILAPMTMFSALIIKFLSYFIDIDTPVIVRDENDDDE